MRIDGARRLVSPKSLRADLMRGSTARRPLIANKVWAVPHPAGSGNPVRVRSVPVEHHLSSAGVGDRALYPLGHGDCVVVRDIKKSHHALAALLVPLTRAPPPLEVLSSSVAGGVHGAEAPLGVWIPLCSGFFEPCDRPLLVLRHSQAVAITTA